MTSGSLGTERGEEYEAPPPDPFVGRRRVDVAGLEVWLPIHHEAVVSGMTVTVVVDARADRLVCTQLAVLDPSGVDATKLRAIPVRELVREAVGQQSAFPGDAEPDEAGYAKSYDPSSDAFPTPAGRAWLRDKGPTPETLESVADVYTLARALGDNPTATVASEFALPRSTAGRWVALARQRGHLGAAAGPRRAGTGRPVEPQEQQQEG